MKNTTVRDFVDGKAELAFASFGVPKPTYDGWSDPKDMEAAKKLAELRKKYREK